MSRYTITNRAWRDLADIWIYTEENWSEAQAKSYTRSIDAGIRAIAADPSRGRACDGLRAGYFQFSAGSHVIFYRRIETGVEVVRILHQRMDFTRRLR
jgi:toxin ParE1/3/4